MNHLDDLRSSIVMSLVIIDWLGCIQQLLTVSLAATIRFHKHSLQFESSPSGFWLLTPEFCSQGFIASRCLLRIVSCLTASGALRWTACSAESSSFNEACRALRALSVGEPFRSA